MKVWPLFRLLVAGALSLNSAYADWQSDPPHFQSDEDRLKFLLQIEQSAPNLFMDAVTTEVDLLELMEKEAALLTELKSNPAYQDLMKARTPLQSITIAPAIEQRTIVPENFKSWKTGAAARLSQLEAKSSGRLPIEVLKQELLASASELVKSDPNALLLGLIQRLPKDKQGPIFKMSLNEKLTALKQNLPGEIVFEARTMTPDEAIQRLRSIFKKEAELQSLATVLALTTEAATRPGAPAPSWIQMRSWLETAGPGEILKVNGRPQLQEIFKTSLFTDVPKNIANALVASAEAGFKPLLAKPSEGALPPTKAGDKLFLREATPFQGIFRGCVGGDCATEYSYAYSNSPNQRTYFVFDAKGVSRGYVEGTIIEVGRKKTLYLSCIAGRRIGKEQTKAIIQGLYQLRHELGVEQLALLSSKRAPENINFQPILQAFEEMADSSAAVPATFPDAEIRKILDSKVEESKYDSVATNREVRLYRPEAASGDLPRIEVHAERLTETPFGKIPVTREQKVFLALDLLTLDKERRAQDIAKLAGLTLDHLEDLQAALENEDALPVKAWMEDIKAEFASSGLQFDERYLENREGHFHFGQFAAPDAMNDSNRKRSVNYLIEELKNEFDGDEAFAFVRRQHSELQKDPKFVSFLESLIVGIDDDQDQLDLLIRQGVDRDVLNPKLQDMAKSIDSLSDYDKQAFLRFARAGALDGLDFGNPQISRSMAALLEEGKASDELSKAILTRLAGEARAMQDPLVQNALTKRMGTRGLESISFQGLQKSKTLASGAQLSLIQMLRSESLKFPHPDTYPARLLKKHASILSREAASGLELLASDASINPEFRSFAESVATQARHSLAHTTHGGFCFQNFLLRALPRPLRH